MIGSRVFRISTTGSTMDVLDKFAREGAEHGLVVLADEQTAGRGRAGRTWVAAPGSSVLTSTLIRTSKSPDRLTTLPLVAGVAVAETIERFIDRPCQLKWPNDVWVDGRKVGGILMQSRLSSQGVDFLNLGIGINVTTPPEALSEQATSVSLAAGRQVDRDVVFDALLDCLETHVSAWESAGGRPSLDEWRRRAIWLGKAVTVSQGDEIVTGTLSGVDDDGALLIEQEDGSSRRVYQGDLLREADPEEI